MHPTFRVLTTKADRKLSSYQTAEQNEEAQKKKAEEARKKEELEKIIAPVLPSIKAFYLFLGNITGHNPSSYSSDTIALLHNTLISSMVIFNAVFRCWEIYNFHSLDWELPVVVAIHRTIPPLHHSLLLMFTFCLKMVCLFIRSWF